MASLETDSEASNALPVQQQPQSPEQQEKQVIQNTNSFVEKQQGNFEEVPSSKDADTPESLPSNQLPSRKEDQLDAPSSNVDVPARRDEPPPIIAAPAEASEPVTSPSKTDGAPVNKDTPHSVDQPISSNDDNYEDDGEEEGIQDEPSQDKLSGLLQQFLRATLASHRPETVPEKVFSSMDLEGVAAYIKEGKCKNIIVMTGAGISVAAGIPDFRTPGTGLYYNLQKYNLPRPTAVFELDFFQGNPEPFYLLAKELYPGNFKPTAAHYFIKLLHDKGLLLRNFTQNIDTLERCTNIDPEVLVEAHGSFAAAHCIACKKSHTPDFVKVHVFANTIPYCDECGGLVKPDIVFFGESLPPNFFARVSEDFPKCDLLLVLGTSLQVQPFASLIRRVPPSTPRVLINKEVVGTMDISDLLLSGVSQGFAFGHSQNVRDVKWIGDCQDGVKELSRLLGWEADLHALINGPKL